MKWIACTERLIVRHFITDDAAFILELLNTPEWIKFIGDRNVNNIIDAENYLLNGPLHNYKKYGFDLWCIELAETKTPIGMCGLVQRDYLPNPDLGFALLTAYTKKGYAFEAATAMMQYAKEELNLSVLLAITLATNIPSVNLLGKAGFFYAKDIEVGDKVLQLYEKSL
jgi:RimJ/RimL family protein N-acetyltransferase